MTTRQDRLFPSVAPRKTRSWATLRAGLRPLARSAMIAGRGRSPGRTSGARREAGAGRRERRAREQRRQRVAAAAQTISVAVSEIIRRPLDEVRAQFADIPYHIQANVHPELSLVLRTING